MHSRRRETHAVSRLTLRLTACERYAKAADSDDSRHGAKVYVARLLDDQSAWLIGRQRLRVGERNQPPGASPRFFV